jgi:hypothetical protein
LPSTAPASYAARVDRVWYFAYGSNMQTATFRGRRGIEFVHAVPGRAAGWRLAVDKPPLLPMGESFATIVPDAEAEVLGVLYEVSRSALGAIDLSEGVLIGNYKRRVISVVPLADGGTTLEAFTLVSERRDPSLSPSTRYMALLIDGALEHGLPAEYVEFLRAIPAHTQSGLASAMRPLLDSAMELMKPRK